MAATDTAPARAKAWKWWVCGLLLLASMINYMDRQTLANAASRITKQFALSQEQYGDLEFGFGWAFAVGSIVFGVLVDRVSVRWVYPGVLLLWSVTGFLTGMISNFNELLVCRTLLGLFEAGHWPCAIKTTQFLLEPNDRAMGNGLLQGGASIGAVLTPLVMQRILTEQLGTWRPAFQIIGAVGLLWIPFWFALVREHDLKPAPREESSPQTSAWKDLFTRRMLVVLIVVACINTCWQTLRAWLPKFLMEGRGYLEAHALYFNSAFYIASDVGCIGAGALALWLARCGRAAYSARMMAFSACAMLSGLTLLIPFLPKGWPLLCVLLLVAAGALGVFPVYHAFTQDISAQHQGKVTGVAGIAAWAFSPPGQKLFGRIVDRTGSFDAGIAVTGCMPLIALAALVWLWNPREK
jgi:MFS transporter, ACS family, hexuronate transporter